MKVEKTRSGGEFQAERIAEGSKSSKKKETQNTT